MTAIGRRGRKHEREQSVCTCITLTRDSAEMYFLLDAEAYFVCDVLFNLIHLHMLRQCTLPCYISQNLQLVICIGRSTCGLQG